MECEEDYNLEEAEAPEESLPKCYRCGQFHSEKEDCGYETCDRCGNYFHYSQLEYCIWGMGGNLCPSCYTHELVWDDD